MKYISFSLFGSNPKYVRGMFKNIELARVHYPTWKCIVWHDNLNPSLHEELNREGAEAVKCDQMKWCSPFAWRFLVNDIQNCHRWISRDCDSRINKREADAVKEWESSTKLFHVIRDHPNHGMFPVLAGMFGAVRGCIKEMGYLLRSFRQPDNGYLYDQRFLEAVIWPTAKNVAMQHGSCSKPFPGSIPLPELADRHFVGLRFDESDNPNPEDLRTR